MIMRNEVARAFVKPSRNGPREFRFNRDQYYHLVDQGFFADRRAELIRGRILERSPQNHPHSVAISLVHRYLEQTFPTGHWVRMQLPLKLKGHSEPEPDVAVTVGEIGSGTDHPTSAVLVVEVSDTTLAYDRKKARLYAGNGVEEYWIVNLLDRVLEVHRQPITSGSGKSLPYASYQVFGENDTVWPLAAPKAKTLVKRLLPSAKIK